MRAGIRLSVPLSAALIAGLLSVESAAAPAWLRLDTPNFTIVGSVAERHLRAVAAEFERFREALTHLLHEQATATPVPTVVIVFESDRAFDPFKPVYRGKSVRVDGMFVGSSEINYIALGSGRRDVRPIFHEYAHLVIGNVTPDLPVWLGEGLAEYYSTFELEDGRTALVGRPIDAHLQELRDSRLLPLGELIAVRHDSPLYNEGQRRNVFYAQSWALVHYLLHGKPSRRELVVEYANAVDGGVDAKEAWQEIFGRESIEAGLRNYVERSRFSMARLTLPAAIEVGTAAARPLSEADAEAFLGDLLWRQLDRDRDALPRLVAAAERSDGTRARAMLARVRAQQNSLVEARALLSRTPPASGDWLTDYAVGLAAGVVFAQQKPSPEAAEETAFARAALHRALTTRPDLAHGWFLLAGLALLSDAHLDVALSAMERARTLAPSRMEYPIRHADVLMRHRDYAGARHVLGPLLVNPRYASLRASIRDRMTFLETAERAAAATPDVEAPWDGTDRIFLLELREVRPGEQRAAGMLTYVDCTREGLILHVRIKGRNAEFRAGRFQDVQFVTYRDELRGNVACGAREPEDLIYITWKADSRAAVAVEFLPRDYRLKE
jgi:hypothetical protein